MTTRGCTAVNKANSETRKIYLHPLDIQPQFDINKPEVVLIIERDTERSPFFNQYHISSCCNAFESKVSQKLSLWIK